jgi:hypothetical protein
MPTSLRNRQTHLIVDGGRLAGAGAQCYQEDIA